MGGQRQLTIFFIVHAKDPPFQKCFKDPTKICSLQLKKACFQHASEAFFEERTINTLAKGCGKIAITRNRGESLSF